VKQGYRNKSPVFLAEEQRKDATVRETRLMRALLALPRALRFYPETHQRVDAQLAELREAVIAQIEVGREPIRLAVRGGRLELNDAEPRCPAELAEEFALKLRRRRLRALEVRPGVERHELLRLGRLVALDHRELLRYGGPTAFLEELGGGAPRVRVQPLGSGPGVIEEPGLSGVAGVVAQALASDETTERIGRIHDLLAAHAADEAAAAEAQSELEDVLHEFLGRATWEELSAPAARRALDGFLDLLDYTLAGRPGDGHGSRLESLRGFFRSLDPEDLSRERETPEGDVDAATADEERTLLTLCAIMVAAGDEARYRERRAMLMAALADRAWSSSALARVLRFLVTELRPLAFETNESLVRAVFRQMDDEAALVEFLASMSGREELARPVLADLIRRSEPFPLFSLLLRSPVLESFRPVLTNRLLEAAAARREALHRWALRNRPEFFRPEVFGPLFRRGAELIGPIVKEILVAGPAGDRSDLIARLRAEGSRKALRLLVLGMPFGGGECDRELLEAVGSFDDPLAVAALREVVHRSNTGGTRLAEAGAALEALARMALEEGRAFLREVASARRLGLRLYRRALRRAAADALRVAR